MAELSSTFNLMKKLLLNLFLIFIAFAAFGQKQMKTALIIYFKDKGNPSYTFSNPTEFLSGKAVARRTQYAIPIDSSDLPVNNQYISQILSNPAFTEITRSRWFNWLAVWGQTGDEVYLKTLPFVEDVTVFEGQYYSGTKQGFEKPFFKNETMGDTPLAGAKSAKATKSYDADYYGQAWNQTQMLNVQKLHEKGFQGQGMTIAVIDAGFYRVNTVAGFDSIRKNGQIKGTKNFVHPSESVYGTDASPIHTHGTQVLSTIATNLPGQMVGTAPKADFWLLRSEDGDDEYIVEEYFWTAAAEFADSVGVDIINSSLGYTQFSSPTYDHTYADMDGNTTMVTNAADKAAAKGILVVNSAGNEGSSAWRYIGAPADADSVLTVGAVDQNGNIASFSSRGPTSDGRIEPIVTAQGAPAAVYSSLGYVSYGSGTSFSGPIIAGAVACLWQSNRLANNMEVIRILKESSSYTTMPNNGYGWGIPDYESALKTLWVKPDENSQKIALKAYPNPFSGSLELAFPFVTKSEKVDIQVYTVAGVSIYKETQTIDSAYNKVVLSNISTLPRGLYIVVAKSAHWSVETKVAKN